MPKKQTRKRGVHDEESARTVLILKRLPLEIVREISSIQLIRAYGIKLSRVTVDPIKSQILAARVERDRKNSEVGVGLRESEVLDQITLGMIARVITKTYAHKGDDEEIGTEEALRLIYRILKQHDPALLERNEKRAIPNVSPANPLAEQFIDRRGEK